MAGAAGFFGGGKGGGGGRLGGGPFGGGGRLFGAIVRIVVVAVDDAMDFGRRDFCVYYLQLVGLLRASRDLLVDPLSIN